MKNLSSQFIIAGLDHNNNLSKKAIKVFEKFYRTMKGKYFIGINDNGDTVSFPESPFLLTRFSRFPPE